MAKSTASSTKVAAKQGKSASASKPSSTAKPTKAAAGKTVSKTVVKQATVTKPAVGNKKGAVSSTSGKGSKALEIKKVVKKKVVKTAALGSTLASEQKKLKIKAGSSNKSKKSSSSAAGAVYAEPAHNSIPFLTYRNACDLALFYCPRKFLDQHEVKTFIARYFKNLPADSDTGKTLLKEVGKALRARLEKGYYSTIEARGEGMKLIAKYKLEPKVRNWVKTGVTFVPNGANPFKASGYQPPVYKKRASKKVEQPAEPEIPAPAAAAADVAMVEAAPSQSS